MTTVPDQESSPSPTLEEMSRRECLDLMGSLAVGRVAVAQSDSPPLVVPVNYVVEDETVVFRSDPGSKLSALRDHPISFQVDVIDPSHRRGWSVLVHGMAHEMAPGEVGRVALDSWAGGLKQHWVRIVSSAIRGRRIRLAEIQRDPRGYL